jgi:hypothetical protein
MVQEHHDLLTAIKNNEKYHEGWHGATSSMTAVLGRMATYSGKVVKWDDAVKYGKSEFPEQSTYTRGEPTDASKSLKPFTWETTAPVKQDADGNYPIPMPGEFTAYVVPERGHGGAV